jgi:hypothetical protein
MVRKAAKQMKGDETIRCGYLGRGGVRREKERSLSVGCVPTQRTLATGEGGGEGRNITYITIEVRSHYGGKAETRANQYGLRNLKCPSWSR